VAHGAGGERRIAAGEFFVTYMTTSLEAGEILTEVRLPAHAPERRWAIQEFARRHGDLALAGVARALDVLAGRCRNARIAAFGVQATALRLAAAEQALEGRPAQPASFAEAGRAAAAALDEPMSCVHASSAYRRHLVGTLTERALGEAVGRTH
jgi:carbon-monoxide dehydrogenase medium subunit